MPELKRILYVEDEIDIQAVAKIALENVGGFNLLACGSGKDALEAAISFNPDLFLLDVMMPVMDGPTTLKALWGLPELKNTPAIFMTAKVQPDEIKAFQALGALDVIAKPFDPMNLANQIKTIWQLHCEQKELIM